MTGKLGWRRAVLTWAMVVLATSAVAQARDHGGRPRNPAKGTIKKMLTDTDPVRNARMFDYECGSYGQWNGVMNDGAKIYLDNDNNEIDFATLKAKVEADELKADVTEIEWTDYDRGARTLNVKVLRVFSKN